MCGRYAIRLSERQLERLGIENPVEFESYNVAPSTDVPIVRQGGEGRELALARWGLIPYWANGKPLKGTTINARAERMREAPAYRDAWRRGRRCLFPALGFYEWQAVEGQKAKQPWFIKSEGDDLLVMAGLWDRTPTERGDGKLESATIITVPANELLTEIHYPKNRMPLILTSEQWDAWLEADNVDELIQTLPDGQLTAWPVSTYVNGVKNDDLRCMERVKDRLAEQPGLFE